MNNSLSTLPVNADPAFAMFFEPTAAIETWLPVMRAAVEWQSNIFEMVTDSQREWFDFANRRVKACTALPQDLGGCESYQNVCIVYADFFQTAVADYQKLFTALVKPDRAVSAKMQYANRAAVPDLHGDEDNDHE